MQHVRGMTGKNHLSKEGAWKGNKRLALCGAGVSPQNVEDVNTTGVIRPVCDKCYQRFAYGEW